MHAGGSGESMVQHSGSSASQCVSLACASRYVASLLAVEKLRAGAWWDATLRPMRRREAAPRASAAVAAAVGEVSTSF